MTHDLKTYLLAGCLMTTGTAALAQSITTVSGRVVNASGEVQFGNAMVVSPEDSSVLQGAPFLNGSFTLSELDALRVLLKLSSLAFRDTCLTVDYAGDQHIELGDIMVEEATHRLDEVVVRATGPLVRERADGSIEVHVENTTLATSTSVDELLSRAPGVVYDAEGQIEVFGKGTAVIFINGIRVSNDRLSTLSPTNIKTIEIISNPGPRYDAEGNAVINITTRRATDEGAKGTLKNYYTHSNFAGGDNRTNVDYSYAKGPWSVNSNYGLQLGNDRMILETTRTRNEPEDFFSSDLTTDWQYEYDNFSNLGVGVQYDIDRKSYLSLQYTGAYEDLGGDQLSDNILVDQETGRYTSTLAWDELSFNHALNANYYLETDSLGSQVFIGSQYASYRHDFDNDIRELTTVDKLESSALINNVGEGDIRIFSTQLDYTHRFNNSMALEVGGKFGYVHSRSFTTFFAVDEAGAMTKDDVLSSDFEYNERIPAGYINVRGNLTEQVNYSLGMRAELTDYRLLTGIEGGAVVEDQYINVFPNASVTTQWSDHVSAYFTYASRINRPSYESLNPFVIYQDAFTSIRGNPTIQPARVHALETGGAIGDWSLKVGYNYTIDLISGGAFQSEDDPRVYILQRTNLSEEHAYFASLSRNVTTKWWKSVNTASVSYNHLIDDRGVFAGRANRPYYYLYSQNSFNINDWFTVYLTAWYRSDQQDGIYLTKNNASVNLGFEKKLLSDALTCNLDFNDIFHRVRAAGEYRLGSTDIIYGRKYNTNYVRMSVAYHFGSLKESRLNALTRAVLA